MPEYLTSRCCMCPNICNASTVCPGIPGTPHPDPSPCRFVKEYVDSSGWRYRIMFREGSRSYTLCCKSPCYSGWHYAPGLWNCDTFDEGQSALNDMAREREWKEAPQ